MDPGTVLGGLAVCCLLGFLIYVVTCVSMREKTYDEVIAEQKKQQELEREKVKNNRKMEKELLKKKYKKGKKGKGGKPEEKAAEAVDNSEAENPSKPKSLQKSVSLETEPEIIEPMNSVILGSKKSKSNSGTRKRSILHNKGEVTPVTEKAVELPHKPIKPLDDLELKKLHDTKAHEVPVQSAAKKGKSQQSQQIQHTDLKVEVNEMKLQKTKATDVEHGIAVEEKGTEAKNSKVVNGNLGKETSLVDMLRTTELGEVEIQSLIEVLLNRQGGAGNSQSLWNKKSQKGDPVAVLKKQLEDKERALQEEQQRAAVSTSQVKELRTSLSAEREKTVIVEKHYQGVLSQQQGESEALKARLASAHASHMADTARVKQQLEQLECEKSVEAAACHKLKQENKILQESLSKAMAENASKGDVSGLKQKVAIMEKELSNNAVRLNASDNAKKSAEDKLKKSEERLKKAEEQLKKSEERIKTLESSRKSSEDGLRKQISELEGRLQKAESENAEQSADLQKSAGALSTVEAECAMWKTKLRELEKHLSSLDKMQECEVRNKELAGNLKTVEKQLSEEVQARKTATIRLQETEEKKQEVEGNLKNTEKQLADALQAQKDLHTQLQELRQENFALSTELKTLQDKQQTKAASTTNGDLHPEESGKNFIQIGEHERIVSEKMAELSKLQSALDAQSKKNNEEVKRAVSEAEKTDRDVLTRLFPGLGLKDNVDHREWLASFEKLAAQQLQHTSSSEKSMKEKVSRLEDENSRLRADVEVFKNNIDILHSEKERIQELEEENRRFQHQSEAYEKNFTQLNADRERLLHLEEENQRLKSSSFANTSSSEELSRLQEENQELQSKLQEKEANIAEVENKLHDLEGVVETEEKKWKEKLRQAEERATQGSESSCREQELEDLTIQQQTQIEHYRTVLTNTEQLLRQLESAEKSWEEKLQTTQDQLHKSQSDCQRAQEELHALRGSQEMQCKVELLEEELRLSTDKLDTVTRENEQLTSKMIVLESQTKAVMQVDTEDLRQEVSSLRGELEGERRRTKELSSTLVRLNGIIKTGQDALNQEQKVVQQLQEQLSDRAKGSGANQEIEQWRETLRSKLSEKEKQLEREIAANRQLSQRLGQLGVLGASAGSSDQGTSV